MFNDHYELRKVLLELHHLAYHVLLIRSVVDAVILEKQIATHFYCLVGRCHGLLHGCYVGHYVRHYVRRYLGSVEGLATEVAERILGCLQQGMIGCPILDYRTLREVAFHYEVIW